MANPTIGATTPRIQYTATSSQTVFTVPFEFLANADLAVYVNGTLKTLTTDYTLTGANTTGGGSLTFVTGRTAGDIVTILSNLAYSRDTNKYTKYGLLPAEVLEADFDALQVQAKQLALADQFALRVPLTDTGSPSMTLPAVATRASKALGFDASGNPTMSASSLADIDSTVQIIDTLNALPAGSSSSVSYQPSGTGAVTTTVQAKLREMVSVKDFGAVGDGTTDDTAAFVAAFAAANKVYAPAPSVSYRISTLSISNNKELLTDGFATVIHQKSGVAAGTRMLIVTGSNVRIGSMKVKGNIAADTGEQNHSVFVYANSTVGNLSNVVIGDISGEDVRGDVLYIGAAASYLVSYVKFGQIIGKNILRNVVSIVGGSYITGDAAITDTSTGYATLDIEPDTVTSTDIYVGYVRGGVLQCAPPLAANTARRIHFNRVELNPAYQANSTPAYFGYAAEIVNAVWLRNTIDFRIDHLDINGHTGLGIQYIYSGGEQRGEGISIGYLRSQNVGASETTYNAVIQAGGINSITIDDGNVALQAVGDQIIIGDSSGSTYTRAIINRMVVDGRVARYIAQGRFSNILINTTNATHAFVNVDDSTILDSDITVPTLISFSSRNVFVNVKASCSSAYYGSTVADMTRINCNWGAVTTGLVTQRAAAAALTGEIAYGSTTATTVGAAGGASALPATPTGYIIVNIAGTERKVPYYAT